MFFPHPVIKCRKDGTKNIRLQHRICVRINRNITEQKQTKKYQGKENIWR